MIENKEKVLQEMHARVQGGAELRYRNIPKGSYFASVVSRDGASLYKNYNNVMSNISSRYGS